jgi:hypothetical protein
VAANGTEFARSADGSVIYNNTPGISRLGFTPSEVEGAMRNVSDSAARYRNQATSYRQAASRPIRQACRGYMTDARVWDA